MPVIIYVLLFLGACVYPQIINKRWASMLALFDLCRSRSADIRRARSIGKTARRNILTRRRASAVSVNGCSVRGSDCRIIRFCIIQRGDGRRRRVVRVAIERN